ncbi:MAG TPA: N-acetyl-gamma-glutamyl-phosphate reductase [Verrucomicrobiae bacterium]|nr:N-acetyl-gamma-glutamyl-phosphate reductase [Verrucomicrobiae bacterium]
MKSDSEKKANRQSVPVAVLGATGYAGVELLRILARHPRVDLTAITSQQYAGKRVSEIYPSLAGKCDLTLEELAPEKIAGRAELIFAALPHETSADAVAALLDKKKRVVDLSADFRLHDPKDYDRWYKGHKAPHLLTQAVYGLTELHRNAVAKARLVANPGCYPTGAILGLAPLYSQKLARGTVLVDAKSGTTGAGRSATVDLSFSEVNENFKAYNVGVHRHTPEIEQELGELARERVPVLFAPHLVPMNRGILSTIYVELKKPPEEGEFKKLYEQFYRGEPFIRLLAPGQFPQAKDVRGSNDCAIGYRYDARTNRLVVVTVLDNLVKGAAGQAVQNMNVMCGWPEDEGLRELALIP